MSTSVRARTGPALYLPVSRGRFGGGWGSHINWCYSGSCSGLVGKVIHGYKCRGIGTEDVYKWCWFMGKVIRSFEVKGRNGQNRRGWITNQPQIMSIYTTIFMIIGNSFPITWYGFAEANINPPIQLSVWKCDYCRGQKKENCWCEVLVKNLCRLPSREENIRRGLLTWLYKQLCEWQKRGGGNIRSRVGEEH